MTAILLSALLFQAPQTSARWDDVTALPAGAAIKLVMKAGDVEGTFVAANAELLVIHLKKGDFSVDRASIKRLDRRLPGSNRGRNTDLGAAIGLIAGAVRSALERGATGVGKTMEIMPFVFIGSITGATAAAAIWKTVYRK